MYSPFNIEHHHNREQQGHQRQRAYAGNKIPLVPRAAFSANQHRASDESSKERNAQIDKNTLRNLPDGNIDDGAVKPEFGGKDLDTKLAERSWPAACAKTRIAVTST